MPGVIVQLLKRTKQDGKVLKLLGTEFLIGRDPSAPIRLATDVASREHARLELGSDGWVIRDLESANGTFVNGSRVQLAGVRPLDEITLGEAGAKVRIVSLDPAPPMGEDGGDSTRLLRLAPRKIPGEKPKRSGRSTRPASPARPPSGGRPSERRPAPPRQRPAPPRERPSRPPPPPRPGPEAYGKPARKRAYPVGAAMGLVFGLLTAGAIWGPSFPYLEVGAPVLWVLAGVGKLAPDFLTQFGPWLSRLLLAAYFATWGFALQRPLSRWILLLALAIAHGAAVFMLHR